jgi:DCN1-like protein 1/2
MTKKGKAVSKDTWSLLFDFIRTIDGNFKEYDETGESDLACYRSESD